MIQPDHVEIELLQKKKKLHPIALITILLSNIIQKSVRSNFFLNSRLCQISSFKNLFQHFQTNKHQEIYL